MQIQATLEVNGSDTLRDPQNVEGQWFLHTGSAETSPRLLDKYSVYIIQPILHIYNNIQQSWEISEWKELKYCMVYDTDYVQMYTLKT